jgi:Golgi nucleoside diphosphatase
VITGKEEGIYSWIAINYLMGRFDHSIETGPKTTIEFDKNKITRAQSISMLEMGGASVQIAFEITSNSQYEELQKRYSKESLNSLISEFNLGCSAHDSEHNYRLFVTTYLGLGANVARSTYVNSLISSKINYSTDNTSLSTKEIKLFDPCLPIDSSETINITRRTKNNNGSTTFVYTLKGSGDFPVCETKLKQVLDPIHESSRQCSMNFSCPLTQLRQTSAPFDNSEFYGFSEFWYTTEDLLRMGGPYSYNKFSQSASSYCSTSWSVILDRFKRKLYRNADNRRLLYQCFKSAWMTSVLHDGFKMPKSYTKYKSASTVNDEQVQWTLGALLYRTRFFPLRDIEQYSGVNYSKANLTSTPYYVNYTLFILCMFAVFLCILIYLRHLHKMVNNNNNSNNISNIFDETKISQSNYDNDLIMIDIPPEKEPLIESLR